MRFFLSALCAMLAVCELSAQITLPYEVDFSTEIPSDWNQTGGSAFLWSWASYGKNGPGCAIVDMSSSTERGTSRIELPAIHLTWLSEPILQFNVAFTRIAFMAPAITVWYDKGEGWKLLDSWGESALADLTPVNHLLEGGDDYSPPLDEENILWHTITVDLASFAGEQSIRFAFQAEFPNGGWVLLDDVRFLQAIAGVEEEYSGNDLRLVPNPATSSLTIGTAHSFARVEIFDILGRKVMESEQSAGNSHLDVSELASGPYWLQLIDRDGRVCARKNFIRR